MTLEEKIREADKEIEELEIQLMVLRLRRALLEVARKFEVHGGFLIMRKRSVVEEAERIVRGES